MSTSNNNRHYSFEFFPPKTQEGREKLKIIRQRLNLLEPTFFSVTYGAGGSTKEHTRDIVRTMRQENLSVAPHLSFGDDSEESMLDLLNEYKQMGVDRIVALRGDTPSGHGPRDMIYANELVQFIRQHFGEHFHLEVAAYPEIHPESTNYLTDIEFLKRKLDAGADSAITQYFYNADAYFYYLEDCQKAGIDKPIIPGIMPITNFTNLKRFSANCGADIPRWLCQRIDAFGDDQESAIKFGEEVVTRLCHTLLAGGAPGIHFYTMNQYEPSANILQNIR